MENVILEELLAKDSLLEILAQQQLLKAQETIAALVERNPELHGTLAVYAGGSAPGGTKTRQTGHARALNRECAHHPSR